MPTFMIFLVLCLILIEVNFNKYTFTKLNVILLADVFLNFFYFALKRKNFVFLISVAYIHSLNVGFKMRRISLNCANA